MLKNKAQIAQENIKKKLEPPGVLDPAVRDPGLRARDVRATVNVYANLKALWTLFFFIKTLFYMCMFKSRLAGVGLLLRPYSWNIAIERHLSVKNRITG